jgi:hypothetical protein
VWYPSGGFGHFVNAVLTLHGKDFVRPSKSLKFSKNGNSHDLDLIVPKYLHDHWPKGIKFSNDKNYCVLIDNGINNEGHKFRTTFPSATVIKICYSNYSWPIVARTVIEKAMQSDIKKQLSTNQWDTDELWARREKYFLYLRDHNFRLAWRPCLDYVNDKIIYLDNLIESYQSCFTAIDDVVELFNFEDIWKQWRMSNATYIDPVVTAKKIVSCVIAKSSVDLSHINDTWTQAVVYYYIWLEFKFEVPHNDYSNWFTNTTDIVKMLDKHGVNH